MLFSFWNYKFLILTRIASIPWSFPCHTNQKIFFSTVTLKTTAQVIFNNLWMLLFPSHSNFNGWLHPKPRLSYHLYFDYFLISGLDIRALLGAKTTYPNGFQMCHHWKGQWCKVILRLTLVFSLHNCVGISTLKALYFTDELHFAWELQSLRSLHKHFLCLYHTLPTSC